MDKNDRRRVVDHLLNPLARLFRPVSEEAAGDYLDALSGYGKETLQEAFRLVRNEHKYANAPAIAELIDACNRAMARSANVCRIASVERVHGNLDFKQIEQIAFKKPMGKRALKEGWARSYLATFSEHGEKFVFTEDYISAQKKALMDMREFIEENKGLGGFMADRAKTMVSLLQVEKDLKKTYLDR